MNVFRKIGAWFKRVFGSAMEDPQCVYDVTSRLEGLLIGLVTNRSYAIEPAKGPRFVNDAIDLLSSLAQVRDRWLDGSLTWSAVLKDLIRSYDLLASLLTRHGVHIPPEVTSLLYLINPPATNASTANIVRLDRDYEQLRRELLAQFSSVQG